MQKTKDRGILSGPLCKAIMMFAMPIAAGNMLQQLFNSADVAIVGKFAPPAEQSQALAAVGSNGAIINLLLNLFIGISVGANVVIARYIGEGNHERVKRASHTAIVVSVISGFIVMAVGLLLAEPALRLMNCPDDVFPLSALYLKIYFAGVPFIMLYNFEAAILRSRGDTKRPLISLTISGVLNVLLNLLFVVVLNMSVAGVALATVIANGVSAAILFYFLVHEEGDTKIEFKKLKIDGRILKEFARIGIPSGLQGAVFSVSNIFVQSSLNSLGSNYMAGSSAALNLEFYIYHLMNGFSQAAVTFTSQNYGAGNMKRCRSVTKRCLWLGVSLGLALVGVMMLFMGKLVYIFTNEEVVAQIAITRIIYVLPYIVINAASDILSGCMRGVGHSLLPALIMIGGVCGVRLIWIYTVFQQLKSFEILMLIYPVSWVITAVGIVIAYFVVRKKTLMA